MQRREDERWLKLCQQAAVEQDPEKLLQLVKEINDLLEARGSAVTTGVVDSVGLRKASNQ